MILEKLWLYRAGRSENLTGNVEFRGEHGKIELTLNEEACKAILLAVGDALIKTSTEVAGKLRVDVIEGVATARLGVAQND